MADNTVYKVKNKMGNSILLQNAAGDEVQLPPNCISTIDASFIQFQMPPLAQAEVIGFDYNALLAPAVQTPTSEESNG